MVAKISSSDNSLSISFTLIKLFRDALYTYMLNNRNIQRIQRKKTPGIHINVQRNELSKCPTKTNLCIMNLIYT